MNRYKPVLFGLLQSFLIPVAAGQWDTDIVIKGVNVQFTYSTAIFPEAWKENPINASGERLESSEVSRSSRIIANAMGKYPVSLLKDNLRAVYFLKAMKFFNVGFGGTNSSDAVYLTNNGEPSGYTDKYLEHTFHHEFSSILLRNFPAFFDSLAWTASNPRGFRYSDPENGVGAIRKNRSSQEVDTFLCKSGFLTQYALSSLENDMNTYAQYLFLPPREFWKIADRFPVVRKKLRLVISFYQKLDPIFTEEYFRKL
jgi:hypothetical protein